MTNSKRKGAMSLEVHSLLSLPFSFLFLLLLISSSVQLLHAVLIQPDNVFSPGTHSFRFLAVNHKLGSLYVGARGHLFRLWLYNINDTSSPALFVHRELTVRPEELEECLRLGNTERECDFWIRQIFLRIDNNLLICSSQAMKPQLGNMDGQTLAELSEPRTQIGICSQHDGLNTTAVYSESGNPDGLPALYSGIRTGLALENHLIYRPPLVRDGTEVQPALRTSIYDSNWLNEPQFVSSHAIGPHVFFFFRETLPAECYNCGRSATVVSRVARICKKDMGGRQVLRQVWTSFVKARLNCSLPGFHFEHIQSVTSVGVGESSSSTPSDTVFYATFTAADQTPFRASAICAFSLDAINQIFDSGQFLEQSVTGTGSWWNPTPVDQVSANRPGTCQPDSRQLSDEDLHFAKSHLLMADAVPALGGTPLVHQKDDLLTRIVADGPDREGRVVLFAYSIRHHALLKVLHWLDHRPYSSSPSSSAAILLSAHRLPPTTKPVHAMAILPSEYLYIASEGQVAQFRLGQCTSYSSCAMCARDPHCSWSIHRRQCFPTEPSHSATSGWIGAASGSGTGSSSAQQQCAEHTETVPVTVFPGDAVLLKCPAGDAVGNADAVWWTHNRKPVDDQDEEEEDKQQVHQSSRMVRSVDGSLVLLNASEAVAGLYECGWLDGTTEGQAAKVVVAAYKLTVDGEDCARPKSVEQFRSAQREWCRRMDAYRSNLSKWEAATAKGGGECPRGDDAAAKASSNFLV